ncbi:MAG: DUF1232 domain-containing protein [Chloroflexi bacterium]|nr:DUF1232 domain-containing protein [Chloroflexota bacterium]
MKAIISLKQKAKLLRTEVYALYLAYKDPRVPWYARAFLCLVIGYALSPIDLIPDFIPVLGYLDDLVIVPAGVVLARRMIPREVLAECREKAQSAPINSKAKWVAVVVVISVWLLASYWVARFAWKVAFGE